MRLNSNQLTDIRRAARALVAGSVIASCLTMASTANAAMTFVFDYNDNVGTTEFLGAGNASRRTALETAGTLFSNYFGSLFTNSGTITLGVQGTNESCAMGCTLAFAGSQRSLANGAGFGNGDVIRNKLLTGTDLNGAANDGVVGVNWGAPWEKDPNVFVAAQGIGNFDFYAALFHEFTHALGFASSLDEAGTDGTNIGPLQGGVDYAGFWSKYDEFNTNCSGTDLINHGTGLTNQPTYNNAKTTAMCFSGANAVAANGGNAVHLYAPGIFADGSTGSHLDGGPGNFPTAMMKYDRNANVDEARTYNGVEIGVLRDLGYSVVTAGVVPEPTSIALVLAALGGAAAGSRRRKVAG